MKLDIGCGGSKTFRLHKVRAEVNCDILKPICKIPNFVLCDAHHLPFKNEAFKIVYLYDVIEHLDSPFKALKEVWRVLEVDGVLEIGTPNALHLPKILRSAFRGYYSPHKDHVQTWGLPELKNILRKVGFNPTLKYATYIDDKKPWYYELLVKLCPFSALRHRKLQGKARKTFAKPITQTLRYNRKKFN